jgi:hypothetical protein
MSITIKQIGQVSAQLKTQIEQFQQNLDQNDVFISQLKEHVCNYIFFSPIDSQFTESNIQLDSLSGSIESREHDSERIRDALSFADISVNSLQQSTSVLDNDAMQGSRLWETSFAAQPAVADYYSRSFSSGRVAFNVPSVFFDRVADRAMLEAATLEHLFAELAKIEGFYLEQLKEGRRPSELNEKVRAAMVQKLSELKISNAFK